MENKLLIVCGGDRLGKGTLIKGLCEHYDYKNITLRHCDKPPREFSNDEKEHFQEKAFEQEAYLINSIFGLNEQYSYHDNIIIYDRFYLGEYVYSQMFRGGDIEELKNMIAYFEDFTLNVHAKEVYLITLTANPAFFHSKEDGNSFAQSMAEKRRELELFKEIHDLSKIKNKLFLKVDENDIFRNKPEILNEVLNFIEHPRKYAPGVYHGNDGDPLWKYKKL